MRVIICGAGQVGYSIAAYLSRENNDVTVIDTNRQLIAQINQDMDVNGIVGHASNPEVLKMAGAGEADLLLAVTYSDEVNMVACQVGHSLFGVPKKIARIRDQAYLDPAWSNLFSRAHMPIDVIISPEIEVARAIEQRLRIPGTTNVVPLADGLVHLASVYCSKSCPILNTQLRQIPSLFPDLPLEIGIIIRNNQVMIPDGNDQILAGDEAYFFTATRHLKRALAAFGHEGKEARNIVIMGGGNIGFCLANLVLESQPGVKVKIIEHDEARARQINEQLAEVLVLNGDALQQDILQEANISETETLVAVTNDDETNILGSLLAKHYGCERVITLVNKTGYTPLMSSLPIDTAVSPRASTVASIMQHVRRGRIKALHPLRDGVAEVMEAEISETSRMANMAIGDLELPDDVVFGVIVRDDQIILPRVDCIIRPGDHVILLATAGQISHVEKMFTVQVDLF